MFSPSPLFAFGFVNLPMLGWLAAAAAPILIHLWSRRKYRETSWAAMEYLLAAVRRRTQQLRFEQWLLLAVRTLLVVLVVLAVAEPYVERTGLALAPGRRAHRVLVLDGSYSMAYKPADKTRFERAKELAQKIVEESPPGDAFTLVLMSSSPRVIAGTAVLDKIALAREIEDIQLSRTTAADLPAAVAAVRRIVEGVGRENPRIDRQEVYFLTDLQRVTWAPKLLEAAKAEFLRQTDELAKMATLFLLDLGQPQADNLAITGLRATDPPVMAGRDVPLQVELKNFGRKTLDHQPVELLVDGRRIARKEVEVLPNGSATVGFSYRFDSPGDHAIEVRAPGDALDIDNRRCLTVPVRQAIRVLCIDGRPSGRPFHGAADYLAVALAPRDQRVGDGPVQVEVAAENALMERSLSGYDCLFLCNVAQFTAGEARALDAYLQGGGCVVFFLGDQVMADRYNSELGVAGLGEAGKLHILPAQLGAVVDHRPQSQFRLDPLGYRHPILQAFRGRGQTSLLTTPVFKYYKLTLSKDSPARTVLALGDGDPLVVEQPVHRGRVVLVATSAEPSWTAMPLWPSFVPLVQEIVAWCAAGRIEQRKVNVDTAESDLAQVDLKELRDEVWPDIPFIHQTSRQNLGAAGGPARGGSRLHVELLYAVLGLLFVETFLSWKLGYHGTRRVDTVAKLIPNP